MAAAWALARAAAVTAGCDAANWPAGIGPLKPAAGGPPMPADPHTRGWLIDRYAADLVQAIGRARGVNSSRTIRVELWGGIATPEMDRALAAHGIEIEACWPNTVHRTQRGRPPAATGEDLAAAARACAAAGRRITVRAVRGEVIAAGGGIDPARCAAWLRLNRAALVREPC